MLSRVSTLTNMRLITMMVMLTRTTTGLTLSGKMNYKKIDWGQGLPKLQLNPSALDIEAWNKQTSLTASAAIGSNFITKMKNGLTKSTDTQTGLTQVMCHAENDPTKEGYDLLLNLDEQDEGFMLHMVMAAELSTSQAGWILSTRPLEPTIMPEGQSRMWRLTYCLISSGLSRQASLPTAVQMRSSG